MIIAYYSLTGNVRRFVNKLGRHSALYTIKHGGVTLSEPFILVTPTTGFGMVPPTVADFVRNNAEMLAGVVASGNRNWGERYGQAGKTIAEQYGVPLLHTFELSGTDSDVQTVNTAIDEITNVKGMIS